MSKDKVLEVQKPAELPTICVSSAPWLLHSLQHLTSGGHWRQEDAQECVPDKKNENDCELDNLEHVSEPDSD